MRRLLQNVRLQPFASTIDVSFVSEARALLELVRHRAYPQASAQMADVHEGDQVDFYAYVGKQVEAPALAAQWRASEPDSTDAALLLAFAELGEGWRLRGETYFHDIPEARKRAFPLKFQAAQRLFRELADRADAPPLAIYGLLHCDVVCGIERDARSDRFAQVMALAPFHAPSVYMMAKASMEKWSGSDEEMWAYLHWIGEHAPRGRDAHAAIASHVVEWTHPWMDECNAPLEIVGVVRAANVPGLADLVRTALLDWLDVEPAGLEPALAACTSSRQRRLRAEFALALYFAGAWEEARLVMRAQGGQVPVEPWCYLAYRGSGILSEMLGGTLRCAGLAHDRICRDLGLDPREVCR
ncbi:hypothetical protein MG068_19015 [Stenotrophomonas sp. ASS1]|uniref:hypothetical protein n=1 Tax=Stenotrophomonas sp. ASS1 TaxID=2282124 RepID=UPI0010449293|nr:hypothetical protein [Stenotrophomonas sp. ASS1]QBL42499.1 hypothetical protein MG068_19015 [Stenotrophomonas sp. ASS1]